MKERIKDFIRREQITFTKLFDPFFAFDLLARYKYIHFFLTGISGVVINLSVTWLLTEFVFGQENYFKGYLIGLSANLVYNFLLHTFMTFKTHEGHFRRFVIFAVYSICMTALQAGLVKAVTPIVGIEYYILVIATIILLFSTVSFFLLKLAIFNENKNTVL